MPLSPINPSIYLQPRPAAQAAGSANAAASPPDLHKNHLRHDDIDDGSMAELKKMISQKNWLVSSAINALQRQAVLQISLAHRNADLAKDAIVDYELPIKPGGVEGVLTFKVQLPDGNNKYQLEAIGWKAKNSDGFELPIPRPSAPPARGGPPGTPPFERQQTASKPISSSIGKRPTSPLPQQQGGKKAQRHDKAETKPTAEGGAPTHADCRKQIQEYSGEHSVYRSSANNFFDHLDRNNQNWSTLRGDENDRYNKAPPALENYVNNLTDKDIKGLRMLRPVLNAIFGLALLSSKDRESHPIAPEHQIRVNLIQALNLSENHKLSIRQFFRHLEKKQQSWPTFYEQHRDDLQNAVQHEQQENGLRPGTWLAIATVRSRWSSQTSPLSRQPAATGVESSAAAAPLPPFLTAHAFTADASMRLLLPGASNDQTTMNKVAGSLSQLLPQQPLELMGQKDGVSQYGLGNGNGQALFVWGRWKSESEYDIEGIGRKFRNGHEQRFSLAIPDND